MKTFALIFLSVFAFSVISCGQKQQTKTDETSKIMSLKALEFQQKLVQDSTNAQLIDVRTWGEFMGSHLKNAKWMDFYKPDFAAQLTTLDKTKPVYLYCHSGNRSYQTLLKLKSMGFTEIYDLDGGITSWYSNNLPTTRN